MANFTVTLLHRVSREISIWFCKILQYLYENNHMGPNYGRDTGKNNSVFETICSSQMWYMGSLPLGFVSHSWPWVSVRYSLKWKNALSTLLLNVTQDSASETNLIWLLPSPAPLRNNIPVLHFDALLTHFYGKS